MCGPLKTISIGMDADGHVNNIPSMQFVTGISVNTQSKSCMLSLIIALWDTHYHALFNDTMLAFDSLQCQLSVHLIQKLIIILCTLECNK